MRIFLALLAFCAVAAGQARVEGRVVSTTGEPVRKATVRLSGGGQPAVVYVEISSSDGRFLFENVAPGRYNAVAQRVGYSAVASVTAPGFTLAAGESKRDVELRLAPSAIVSGKVTDSDGDPLPSVQVQIQRRTWAQGRMRLQTTLSLNTDDRGEYRSMNLAPGRYYVMASDPSSRMIGSNPNEIRGRSALEANLPTYHPGSADSRGAILVDAKGGVEASNVNIRMRRGRTYTARGVALDENGAPAQVQVMLYQKSEEGSSANTSVMARPGTGLFEFRGLTPGDYTLVARSTPRTEGAVRRVEDFVVFNAPGATPVPPPAPPPAAPSPIMTGRLELSIGGGDVEGLTLRLTQGTELTGRLKLDGDGDLAEFLRKSSTNVQGGVLVSPDGNRSVPMQAQAVMQRALPSLLLSSEEGTSTRQVVSADGTFRIANLAPSKYTLSLSTLAPGAYIKAIRWGSQDISNAPLDLTSGNAGSLEILISPRGAAINGVAPPGVMVTMWPAVRVLTDQQGGVRNLRSSAQGTFSASGLAPGEYYVAAWEEVSQDLSRIPDFLDLFRAAATKVRVAEGETAAVETRLISKDTAEKAVEQFR